MAPPRWYACKIGKDSQLYATWEECSKQVTGIRKAIHKRFFSREAAEAWLGITVPCRTEKLVKTVAKTRALKIPVVESGLVIYTDGSCTNNGRPNARGGVGVWFGDNDPRNVSERLVGKQTNQRAEVTAGIRALEGVLKMPSSSKPVPVFVKTDSKYLMNGITTWIKNWRKTGYKGVQNADIFRQLDALVTKCKKHGYVPSFSYVRAHCGIHGNEQADAFACEGGLRPK